MTAVKKHRECISHHHACDCREALFAELVEALENCMGNFDTPISRRLVGMQEIPSWLQDARSALAKAKGQV